VRFQKGDVRIRYEEAGSGFPLLVTPGGGLNSRVSNWPTAVINAMEEFKNDFRCITIDQRNANGGESSGPVRVDNPWDAFADDQLGLMDHLGIREFFYMGYCIGSCFAGKLLQRAPNRVVAAVFCLTGQIGGSGEVLGPAQPLRLEPAHLAGRSSGPGDRRVTDHSGAATTRPSDAYLAPGKAMPTFGCSYSGRPAPVRARRRQRPAHLRRSSCETDHGANCCREYR
jgi:pimeloyl-ACP methyl ester carboxylesterase